MLTGTINFTGKNFEDCESAIGEALRLIRSTFTRGGKNRRTCSYDFAVRGEEDGYGQKA